MNMTRSLFLLMFLLVHLLPADVKSTVNMFGMVEADIEYSSDVPTPKSAFCSDGRSSTH